jgi:uncharacterized lipoprotein YbaY/heat shock protein HslJ
MPKDRVVIMVSRLVVVVGMVAVLAGDAHAQMSSVMASVSFPEAVKSRTAVLEVTLEDVTAPDAPAVVVGTTRMPRPGQSPVMMSVPYDPSSITPSRRYVLRGRLLDGAVTVFSSATPVRVLTGGHGSVANLSLTKLEPVPVAAPVEQAPKPVAVAPAPTPAPNPAPAPVVPAVKPAATPAPAPKAASAPVPVTKPAAAPKPVETPAPKAAPVPTPAPKPAAAPAPKPAAIPAKPAPVTPKSFSLALPPPEPIVDLPATFTGTMPCADCAGVRVELTLLANSSYSLKRTFEGPSRRVEEESGSWGYSSDRIVLVLKSSNDRWSWFAVRGAEVLRAVDARGESLGLRAPADLQRTAAPAASGAHPGTPAPAEPINAPLEGVAWRLNELENKPVRPASRTHRDIVLTFDPEDGGFSGVSGCNQLSGTFEATWRTLTVTPTSPLRLCRIDDGTERALIRTIKATRAYRITGQVLEWLDERGSRLARFELMTR